MSVYGIFAAKSRETPGHPFNPAFRAELQPACSKADGMHQGRDNSPALSPVRPSRAVAHRGITIAAATGAQLGWFLDPINFDEFLFTWIVSPADACGDGPLGRRRSRR